MQSPNLQTVLSQITQALEHVHSPLTPDRLRLEASNMLEGTKTQYPPEMLLELSLSLIRNYNNPVQSRHYGYQIFENVINSHYNSFTPQQRLYAQSQLISMIQPIPTQEYINNYQNSPHSVGNRPPQALNQQQLHIISTVSYLTSPLINYAINQASILTSKLSTVIVRVLVAEWNQGLFDQLLEFLEKDPSIDMTLFFIETLNKLITTVGQPTPTIPDSYRKNIFTKALALLQQFLPHFFKFSLSLIDIISCNPLAIQAQLPYLIIPFPQLYDMNQALVSRQLNTLNYREFSWFIEHTLTITLQLSQQICERTNLDDGNTSNIFTILTQLVSLPETSEEVIEHILLLLQRKTGIKLQHQPSTLLQISQTLIELSVRILERKSICNPRFCLFPSSQKPQRISQTTMTNESILLKALNCLHELILAFSGPMNGILTTQQRKISEFEYLKLNTGLNTDQQTELTNTIAIINGINTMRLKLLQLLCGAASDPLCNDMIAQVSILCLLDCTSNRLYSTYITSQFMIDANLIELTMKELWGVILINVDRERTMRLKKKVIFQNLTGDKRFGAFSQDDEKSGNNPQSLALHDVMGTIRSSIQLLSKNVCSRSPHLVLQCLGQTLHSAISTLLQLVSTEQQKIAATQTFETTITHNSKEIQYIFQTSYEFNQLLYPSYHFGGNSFFTSLSFLELEATANIAKTIFQQFQLLSIRVPTPTQVQGSFGGSSSVDPPVQLTPSLDFVDWSTLTQSHLDALLPILASIHSLLLTAPSQCLGYLTHIVNIIAKLTVLYAKKKETLTQTIQWLLAIASLNPNDMLGSNKYVGSTSHDGVNYNSFFIHQEETLKHQAQISNTPYSPQSPLDPKSPVMIITHPDHAKCDSLSAVAGTGQVGINFGPLLDLRKHALHAILHLTKHLPDTFEGNYLDFCTHILNMVQSSSSSSSSMGKNQQQKTDYISIPTETVVLIEIILCLGLYFGDQNIILTIYQQMISPHIHYLVHSFDISYFLSDPYRFSSLLYGSHDEYRLIQSQLLQWNEVNINPERYERTPNSGQNSIETTNDDVQTLNSEREHVLPKPSPATILIPSSTPHGQNSQANSSLFDNRVQSFRKQFLFALHTLQCITKLLYTQSQSLESYAQTIYPVLQPVINAQQAQLSANPPPSSTTTTTTSTTTLTASFSHSVSANTIPGPRMESLEQYLDPNQLKQHNRLKEQSSTCKQMLNAITQQLYSPVLRMLSMFLYCSSEKHISTLSNRLQSVSLGSGFDHFLALFVMDRFVTLQPSLASQLPPVGICDQSAIDGIWSASTREGIKIEQSQGFGGAGKPSYLNTADHQNQSILSGFIDASVLPVGQYPINDPNSQPKKLKIMPADKAQFFLRYLWAWNDNFFETLSQLISTFSIITPDVVAADIFSIQKFIPQYSFNSSIFYASPNDTMGTITQSISTTHPTLPYTPTSSSNISNTSTPPILSHPLLKATVTIAQSPNLPRFRPYYWSLIISFINSLPFRRQRLALQRIIVPLFKIFPQAPLSIEQYPSIQSYVPSELHTIIPQLFPQSSPQFATTIPLVFSSLVSTITTNLQDALLYAQFASQSTFSTNVTLSPTLSLLSDAFSQLPIPTLRRLRGTTANIENLRSINNTNGVGYSSFCAQKSTHGVFEGSDITDISKSSLLYVSVHNIQHPISLCPLSSTFQSQLFEHQIKGSVEGQPLLSSLVLKSCENLNLDKNQGQNRGQLFNNPLTQTQSTLLNTIMHEIQLSIQNNTNQGQQNQNFVSLLKFPGELTLLQSLITSTLSRYDFSRHSASIQQQQQQPSQNFAQNDNNGTLVPKALTQDPLHIFTEQLDFTEVQLYLNSAVNILQSFSSSSLNNERNLSNALGLLKQSQMFLSLPLCSRLAEFTSTHPQSCALMTSLWDTVVLLNYSKHTASATRFIISLLRYVGIPLSFASICVSQRQNQQIAIQQGQLSPHTPPFILDAFNMGLYYRVLYYQPQSKDKNDPSNANNANNSGNKPNSSRPAQNGPNDGLLIRKTPHELMAQLPTSAAASIFEQDDYWLHLCNSPSLPNDKSNLFTDTCLNVAPQLLDWLRNLLLRALRYIQRHFYVLCVLSLSERQQLAGQALGSPVFDDVSLDNMVILVRDIITLFTQCQSYVTHDGIVQLMMSSLSDIQTNVDLNTLTENILHQMMLSTMVGTATNTNPNGNGGAQQIHGLINTITNTHHIGVDPNLSHKTNPYLTAPILSLLIQYARKIDVDQVNHDGSGGKGLDTEENYFSYSDLINNKKGVLSEKNNSQPLPVIPQQTRNAKDQFKLFLFRIVCGSFLPAQ
jgi:hypothetical protein